jgi:hypothetical protein
MSYFTEDMRDKSIDERKRISAEREKQVEAELKVRHEDDKYEEACERRNALSWLPLLIGFMISICFWCSDSPDGLIIGVGVFMLSLLITAISSTAASAKNVSDAKYYDLTEASNKRIKKETTNRNAGVASLVGGTASTIHHAKKAGKELLDVEHWKAMK